MKSSFESLIEKIIPEVNFLTSAGGSLKPGHVLESHEKDIVAGYLPEYLVNLPSMSNKSFDLINEPYDIRLDKSSGTSSQSSALNIMKFLGLEYNQNFKYKVDFDIKEITSTRFKENLEKINFEIALSELKKENPQIFRKFKGYFLVLRVLYATEFEVKIEIDRGEGFEAELELKSANAEGKMKIKRKESSLLISTNPSIPFGVIGYKIKGNKLKEVDR